jgi:thiol-disulfide isomerase/thioredoxin
MASNNYAAKYLKYKQKYTDLQLSLKNQKLAETDSSNKIEMVGGADSSDKIDVLLFKADWCGHCKNFKPVWNQLQNEFNKKFNFITYDHGVDQEMVKKMKINGYPTIMFKDGKEIQQYNGPREYNALQSILTNLVKIENETD